MKIRNQDCMAYHVLVHSHPAPGTFRESSTETAGRGKMVFRKLRNSAAEFFPEVSFHVVPSKMASRG